MGLPDRILSEPLAGCSACPTGIGRSGAAGGGAHHTAGYSGGSIGRRHDAVVTVAVGEGGSAAGARADGWPVAKLGLRLVADGGHGGECRRQHSAPHPLWQAARGAPPPPPPLAGRCA